MRLLANPASVPECVSYFFLTAVLLFSPDELVATRGGPPLVSVGCSDPQGASPKVRDEIKNFSFQNSALVKLHWLR